MAIWAIWLLLMTIGSTIVYLCWLFIFCILRKNTIQILYDSLHTAEQIVTGLGITGLVAGIYLRFLPNAYTFYILSEKSHRVFLCMGWIFCLGSIVRIIRFIWINRMNWQIEREDILVSEEIQSRYLVLCRQMEIPTPPELKICSLVTAPYLSGIIRPKIFVSHENLKRDDWKMVLTHELFHFRNHDILYRGLLQLLTILFWFNPMFYLWKKQAVQVEEQYCDYSTVERYWINKQDYQLILLRTARENRRLAELSVFLSDAGKRLKSRILQMSQNYRIGKGRRLLFQMIFLLITAGLALGGTTFSAAQIDKTNRTQLFMEESSKDDSMYLLTDRPLKKESVCGMNQISICSGSTWTSGLFYLWENDEYLSLTEYINHPDSMVRIGIICPNGDKLYMTPERSWESVHFSIEETGWYQIHIENRSLNQICINCLAAK